MRQLISMIFFILLSVSMNAQEPIKVSVIAPTKAVAGQKFRVIVELSNQAASGFAKFTQKLPMGFVAVEDEQQSAQFSFENQNVELFWLRTPAKQSKVSYTIIVADSLNGNYQLESNFNYQLKNKSAFLSLNSNLVEIESLNQYLANGGNSEELQNLVVVPFAKLIPAVQAKRTRKYVDSAKQVIAVRLEIENMNHIQKASLIEKIPAELEAVVTNKSTSNFVQSSNELIFNWDKLPLNKTVIEYTIRPKNKQSLVLTDISGTLNLENAEGHTNLDIYDAEKSLLVFNSALVANPKQTMLASNENKVLEEKSPSKISNTAKTLSASAGQSSLATKLAKSLKKGSSVSYKIQIAAFSKPVPESYFKQLNVTNSVNKEQHNGLYKYTIGEFNTYVEADAYKEHLLKTTKLESAFIAAYKKTERIEVSTALRKTKK